MVAGAGKELLQIFTQPSRRGGVQSQTADAVFLLMWH